MAEMTFNFRIDQIPASKDLRDSASRLIFAYSKQ